MVISVATKPMQFRRADVTALPNEPTKVLTAASRLFTGKDDLRRWHARARTQEIDRAKWRSSQPDRRHLPVRQPQRVESEVAADVVRRIADDICDAPVAAKKIRDSVEVLVTAIDEIDCDGL